jgi:hypothetical protein
MRTATDGGWSAARADGTFTRIRGPSRFNLNLRARGEQALSEAERDIVQPAESRAGEGAARTLLPAVRGTDLSLSGATRLGEGVDLSGTGRLSLTRRDAQLGLTPAGLVREQDSRVLGGRLNSSSTPKRAAGPWPCSERWMPTGGGSIPTSTIAAAKRDPQPGDHARPVGAHPTLLDASGRAAAAQPWGDLHQRSLPKHDGPRGRDSSFTERSYAANAGLLVPIAGGPDDVLRPVGELNLSLDAGLTRVEDSGTFTTGSLGLVWEPALAADERRPVARQQPAGRPLPPRGRRTGDPRRAGVRSPDRRVGPGRRDQRAARGRARPRSEQERLSLTLTPPSALDLRFESEFSRRRERDVVGDLPLASSLVLAAFRIASYAIPPASADRGGRVAGAVPRAQREPVAQCGQPALSAWRRAKWLGRRRGKRQRRKQPRAAAARGSSSPWPTPCCCRAA